MHSNEARNSGCRSCRLRSGKNGHYQERCYGARRNTTKSHRGPPTINLESAKNSGGLKQSLTHPKQAARFYEVPGRLWGISHPSATKLQDTCKNTVSNE